MTATTQSRMNVGLALTIPAVGFAYLISGLAVTTSSRSAIVVLIACGVLWLTATVALNTTRRPQPAVVGGVPDLAENLVPRRAGSWPSVVNVSRANIPWRWTSVLLLPVELLVLAWSVPVVILLIMVPIGLAVATVLRIGQLIAEL
jgi:hypothetical protein